MKHKYKLSKTDQQNKLKIVESAELDKGMFTTTCEESYDSEAVLAAIAKGKNSLISTLRTQNLFPPEFFIGKIADSIIEFYDSSEESIEITINEIDMMASEDEPEDEPEDTPKDELEKEKSEK